MLYQISNGAVSFADNYILRNINFEIRNTEKIAVVGRNGCGKTTLLKLIAGEVELQKRDSDEDIFIAASGNPEIGYLKQIAFEDPNCPMELEVRKAFCKLESMKEELERRSALLETDHSEAAVKAYTNLHETFTLLGGYYYEKEYETLIKKFGFSQEDKKKPLCEFSGGQQTKIAFIKLLLSKPDILLLDEPTNHLDVETVEWLEGYIKNYPKAVVVVSHDRMFLDNTVDVVYEIEHHTAKRYPGNYSNFIKVKKENYDRQMKAYLAQQAEIKRLEELVERFKNKPTKASMARSKLKAIEHMEKIYKPDSYDNKAFHAHFQPEVATGNDVLSVMNLAIGYDTVLSTISIEIKKGDKLGIIGGNGIGKSTFLKTIIGQVPALGGEYRYGTNVQIGYYDQQMAMYQSKKTVLDDFWDEFPNLTQTEARSLLGAFLFSGEDVFKTVDMLSGGEKVRLALCKILKRKPNVLILDEPTNHMDIVGKEALEAMLKDYEGTIIFVSHDRYFIRQLSNKLLVFEDGNADEYIFGYDDYMERQKAKLEAQSDNAVTRNEKFGVQNADKGVAKTGCDSDAASAGANAGGVNTSGSGKYYNPGKEQSKRDKKIKKLEEQMEDREQKIAALKEELSNPLIQSDYVKLGEIQGNIDALEEELLSIMEEWDELNS